MSDIKPCPFCGKDAECHDSGGDSSLDDTTYLVTCGTYFCYGDVVLLNRGFYSRQAAISAWNVRPN